MLLEDIEKRLSKYARGKKLPKKNKEEGRIMNSRQTTCKWIDN
jgi:hypothetical protein